MQCTISLIVACIIYLFPSIINVATYLFIITAAHPFQSRNIFSTRTINIPPTSGGNFTQYCVVMNFSQFPIISRRTEVANVFFNPSTPDLFQNNEHSIKIVFTNPRKKYLCINYNKYLYRLTNFPMISIHFAVVTMVTDYQEHSLKFIFRYF